MPLSEDRGVGGCCHDADMSDRPSVKRLLDEQRIRVWMPYQRGNREWLRQVCGRGTHIQHEGKGVFRVARPHLPAVITRLAAAYGAVEVTLQFAETQRCDTRCQQAKPSTWHDCVCSCLASNHGGVGAGRRWLRVGHTSQVQQQRRTQHYLVRPASRT